MKKTEQKEELNIERQILVGLITTTEFTEHIRPIWKDKYMGSVTVQRIASWCVDYFDEYHKAPGRTTIDDIAHEKLRAGEIPKEMQEDIDEFISGLDDVYDEEYNLQYSIDRTDAYLKERHLELHNEKVEDLFNDGEIDAANELVTAYAPLSGGNGTLESELESTMYTSTDFLKLKITKPAILLRPWLTEQSLTMIYGPRGSGKTWLCMIISIALTRKEEKGIDRIGTWDVARPAGVLYIDGEMNNSMLQENIRNLTRPLPEEDPENPLYIMSSHDFASKYEKSLNLDLPTRKAITELLKRNKKIKVLVLDNASALTPGLVENSKEDWDPVNQWMISVKHLGVSVILVHHAGQSGKQRGTTGREDAMDTVIKVDLPKNYNQNEDYAWFSVTYEKARNLKPGAPKREFNLRIVPHPKGGLMWEEDAKGTTEDKMELIKKEIIRGEMRASEIAEEYKITRGRVSQIKKQLRGDDYIKNVERNGKTTYESTQKGDDYLEGYDD